MKTPGFRLHTRDDHAELDGRDGHDFRLWLNLHMLRHHLERPSLKGTEAQARARHSALHDEMEKRASAWSSSQGIEVPAPGSAEAKQFEASVKPPKMKSAGSKKKRKPMPKPTLTKEKQGKKPRGPRIRVVSGGAPSLGKRR